MKSASKVKIVQNPEKEIPVEILAQHIVDVSRAWKTIVHGRLTQRVLVLLIRDITGLNVTDIEKVLDALPVLEKRYLK